LLVDVALARINAGVPARILDVGTGTGCIGVTLALERPDARITVLDVSPNALALARENALRLNASNVELIQSNWFAALAATAQFDLIVSNPPYIVPGDAHLTQGDLRFEPAIALADAVDGLESYRQLIRGACKHLRNDGWLIVEHGYDQGDTVPALFRDAGFTQIEMLRDLAGLARVSMGRLAGSFGATAT
jgi:release factor glutamine methyltransferase